MALTFWDGFGRYGTVIAQMLAGVWAQADNCTIGTTAPAPPFAGQGRVHMNTAALVRKVLPAAVSTVGIGFRLYLENLPASAGTFVFEFRNASNVANLTIVVDTTGTISARSGTGTGTLLGTSATAPLVAGSWQHIEISLTCATGTGGSLEVRVEGVTVLTVTGVNTAATGTASVGQIVLRNNGDSRVYDFTDFFTKDDLSFYGGLRSTWLVPNADTAQADWTKSTGTVGYTLIAEIPASAADYIEAAAAGNISRFGLSDLPANVVSVAGVASVAKALKTDTGNCSFRPGVYSNATLGEGADIPLATTETYWWQNFLLDPSGSVAWTAARVNALLMSEDRTV